MKLTITEIAVHKENESPVVGDLVTYVKLMDDGGGEFIKLVQYTETDVHEIRLDFNEIEHVFKAIEMIKEARNV